MGEKEIIIYWDKCLLPPLLMPFFASPFCVELVFIYILTNNNDEFHFIKLNISKSRNKLCSIRYRAQCWLQQCRVVMLELHRNTNFVANGRWNAKFVFADVR